LQACADAVRFVINLFRPCITHGEPPQPLQ
jgi:hypothetical protein